MSVVCLVCWPAYAAVTVELLLREKLLYMAKQKWDQAEFKLCSVSGSFALYIAYEDCIKVALLKGS